jgi:hypothetical protein
MLSNSLKMIKLARNMSECWSMTCKNKILTLVHLLVLLYELFFNAPTWITLSFPSFGAKTRPIDSLSSTQYGCVPIPSLHVLPLWFQIVFFGMDISACSGTTAQKQRRRTRLLDASARPLYQFRTNLCPLCMPNHFQSLGTVGKLTHHHSKFLFRPDERPNIFSFKTSTTCWNRFVGKHRLSKKGRNYSLFSSTSLNTHIL